jgi:hypothetical protein
MTDYYVEDEIRVPVGIKFIHSCRRPDWIWNGSAPNQWVPEVIYPGLGRETDL